MRITQTEFVIETGPDGGGAIYKVIWKHNEGTELLIKGRGAEGEYWNLLFHLDSNDCDLVQMAKLRDAYDFLDLYKRIKFFKFVDNPTLEGYGSLPKI